MGHGSYFEKKKIHPRPILMFELNFFSIMNLSKYTKNEFYSKQ